MVHGVSIFERYFFWLLFLLADSSWCSRDRLFIQWKRKSSGERLERFFFVHKINWRLLHKTASLSAKVSNCAAPSSSSTLLDFLWLESFRFRCCPLLILKIIILNLFSLAVTRANLRCLFVSLILCKPSMLTYFFLIWKRIVHNFKT